MSIPKTIHYCWFGHSPLPPLAMKCIESWRKFMPDYAIKRWDESNFNINMTDYTRAAYAAGKYAFVSDYARFYVLYHEGGLYFDTDVEIIKPLDDIIASGAFMGCENTFYSNSPTPSISIAPGLCLGAKAGMKFYEEIMAVYELSPFLNPDNTPDSTTVVEITTAMMRKKGWIADGSRQRIADITIYPPTFFSPKNTRTGEIELSPDTRSIHHFAGSWLSDSDRLTHRLIQQFRLLPKQLRWPVARLIATLKCDGPDAAFRLLKSKLITTQ